MIRHLPRILTFTALFAAALFLSVVPVGAQSSSGDAVGLMAIPARLGDGGEVVVQPGSTIQLEVRVRNTSARPLNVRTIAEDFIIGEDGVTPVPVEEMTHSRWSLAQWIQIPQSLSEIQPGGSVNVPFVVQVPTDALPGGRYAMIMHQVEGATADLAVVNTGGQTAINQRVGTLVYLRIDGPIVEDANIRNLQVPFLTEFGPVQFSFEIENLSDIHIRPTPKVTVRNWFGSEIDSFSIETNNIFPLSQRPFPAEWGQVWGFGRYTFDIEAGYGETGKVALASASFWMIPYKIILVIFLLILSLLAMVLAVRRHLSHRGDLSQKHIRLLEEKIRNLESQHSDKL